MGIIIGVQPMFNTQLETGVTYKTDAVLYGKESGAEIEYHWVKLPFNVGDIFDLSGHEKIRKWCVDNFGVQHKDRWIQLRSTYYFVDAEDAVVFTIMWS